MRTQPSWSGVPLLRSGWSCTGPRRQKSIQSHGPSRARVRHRLEEGVVGGIIIILLYFMKFARGEICCLRLVGEIIHCLYIYIQHLYRNASHLPYLFSINSVLGLSFYDRSGSSLCNILTVSISKPLENVLFHFFPLENSRSILKKSSGSL